MHCLTKVKIKLKKHVNLPTNTQLPLKAGRSKISKNNLLKIKKINLN